MPLRRRLVSEETMDIIINSEVAQVLGRILMLPLAITKEILKHLDTKLLTHDIYSDHGPNSQIPFMTWTGTQRMQNRARLRRRMGQGMGDPRMAWILDQTRFRNLDDPVELRLL